MIQHVGTTVRQLHSVNRNKSAMIELDRELVAYAEEKGLAGLHPGMGKKLPCNAECLITETSIESVKSGLVTKYREQAECTTTCTE